MNENLQLPITKLGINKEHCKALRQEGIVSISDLIAAFPHVGDLYESPLSSEDVDSILEKLGELDIDYYRETPATKGDIVSLLVAIRSMIREELESVASSVAVVMPRSEAQEVDEVDVAPAIVQVVSSSAPRSRIDSLTIPIGVYKIGVDIPAGRYNARAANDGYCYYRLGREMKNGSVERLYAYDGISEQEEANLFFVDDTYLDLTRGAMIIRPFEPLM